MNWHDLLPYQVAKKQIAYERRHSMRLAHESGATMSEIASATGLSKSRVTQIVEKARREIRHKYAEKGRVPIDSWGKGCDIAIRQDAKERMQAAETKTMKQRIGDQNASDNVHLLMERRDKLRRQLQEIERNIDAALKPLDSPRKSL